MSEERKLILQMVADGKISADEAEKLLQALDDTERTARDAATEEMQRTRREPVFGEGLHGFGNRVGRTGEELGETIERAVNDSLRALDGALRGLEINLEKRAGAKNRDDLRHSMEEKIRRTVERQVEHARRAEERVRETAERAEQRAREHAARMEERAREQAMRMEEKARRMADRAREMTERAERSAAGVYVDHQKDQPRIIKVGIAIDKESVERNETLTMAGQAGDTLHLENRVGDVRVAFYDGDEIEVAVRKVAWGEDQADANVRADATQVKLVREGTDVRVETVRPSMTFVGVVRLKDTRLDYTVKLPHGANLKINNKGGDIVVLGGEKVGVWNLESKVGDIDAKVAPAAGFTYDLHSEYGSVKVALADHESTQVEYPNRKGTVRVGKFGDGSGRIEIRSKTGELRLIN